MLRNENDRPRAFWNVCGFGEDYFSSENQKLDVAILAGIEFLLAPDGLFSDSCSLDNLLGDVERCLVGS